MEYNFREIEQKWQSYWKKNNTYKTEIDIEKPKYYVLDMFPYPSGAGLHVGHPLGYIASDIFSRYKRLKGYNVLHPMGYDAYGLPAEQYAIQTGQHPAVTTKKNIARYREQLDKIGFCYDWSREIRTCEPDYYHWTQWAFIQMFNHFFNTQTQKAQPIDSLIKAFEINGTEGINASCTEELIFTANDWNSKTETEQQEILLNYRIAYLADLKVNWCTALGTVLANDEVSEGVSVRGGHPVEQRVMRQWSLRVSAYAQRLLDGLNTVEWTESLKETQKNWIGRSEGAEMKFYLPPTPSKGGGVEQESRLYQLENSNIEDSKTPKYYTTNKFDWHILNDNAKRMRTLPTEAESILWNMLRSKKLGYKFRQQHPIDIFIPDFVCLEKKLIVEVDGGYHFSEEQKILDAERTRIIEQLGYKIIRFTNEEVISNPYAVVAIIQNILTNTNILIKSISTSIDDNQVVDGTEVITTNNTTSTENAKMLVSPAFGGGQGEVSISVFTTRADTIFGVTFMVLAPESDLVKQLTTSEQKVAVENYVAATKKRTERERIADRRVTGVFSGSFAVNPVSGTEIPIWISDYVLSGYGTGAIMAVPAHDSRDYAFAKHFNLPIIPLIEGCDVSEESLDAKEGIMMNSGFLNGLTVKEAIVKAKEYISEKGIGRVKVNFRLRDAIFSRQRYWGEPFPVYYKDNMPYMLVESRLPLELPEVDKFLPTEKGEPPLGRAKNWETEDHFPLELCTMPGFAGSSAYYLRYMDPKNNKELVSTEANNYWRNVDLYIGGTEHATGHLVYSRFWNKFLFDLGIVCEEEPFKKLVNQGMIQGRSNFVYRLIFMINEVQRFDLFISYKFYTEIKNNILYPFPHHLESWFSNLYSEIKIQFGENYLKNNGIDVENYFEVAKKIREKIGIDVTIDEIFDNNINKDKVPFDVILQNLHVDVNIVSNDILDTEAFKSWNPDYKNAEFILEDGKYHCGWAVEKMSKSMYNVVNPDDIVEKYGADTLRLYEMFLGPLEQSKPWDTNGIDGVHRFLKRLWSLFYKDGNFIVNNENPSAEELKILHKTIKKITFDIENFSYNTSVSAFMICVNELFALKCSKKEILEPLVILLAPFAPHVAEELYQVLGNNESVCDATFPICIEDYLKETAIKYPISFNGKVRFMIELPADMGKDEVEKIAMANEQTIKQLDGATPKKVIVVQGKIVNIVI